MVSCPMCLSQVVATSQPSKITTFECSLCRTFSLSGKANATLESYVGPLNRIILSALNRTLISRAAMEPLVIDAVALNALMSSATANA